MMTDHELLQRYADEQSEIAFAELVQRRIGLVHGTALRRVGGDAHLAQDVTQQVFVAVAREAGRLARHPVLCGWLYTTTRNVAARLVRAERRRHRREREASIMDEIDSAGSLPDLGKLRINLDKAMDRLGERDRTAVFLRFFEGLSFSEIGTRLQLTENAARMRVERAIDKLHAAFSSHGISSTAAAIGVVLAAQTSQAAPAGLAATLTHMTLAGAGLSSSALGFTFMSMTKLHSGITVALLLATAGSLLMQQRTKIEMRNLDSTVREQHDNLTRLRVENDHLKQKLAKQPVSDGPAVYAAIASATAHQADLKSRFMPRGGIVLAPGLTPIGDLEHGDRSTAKTALEIQLWAAAQGAVDLEESVITFSPETRRKVETLMATLPDSIRANYSTPEKLMAAVLAGSPHPVAGVQILGETVESPDRVMLQMAWQHADDDIVHHSNVELQRDSSGWRMVVPAVLVDRAAVYLQGNADATHSPSDKK